MGFSVNNPLTCGTMNTVAGSVGIILGLYMGRIAVLMPRENKRLQDWYIHF